MQIVMGYQVISSKMTCVQRPTPQRERRDSMRDTVMETRTVRPPVAVHILSDRGTLTRRVSELTRERDAALAAVAAERDRNTVLLRQVDHLASEIFALRRGQASEWKPRLVSDQSRQLAFALETIRNMERSWFWRLRTISVRIARLWS
jgi:hypothetical protein